MEELVPRVVFFPVGIRGCTTKEHVFPFCLWMRRTVPSLVATLSGGAQSRVVDRHLAGPSRPSPRRCSDVGGGGNKEGRARSAGVGLGRPSASSDVAVGINSESSSFPRARQPARPPLSDCGVQLVLAELPARYCLPFLPSDRRAVLASDRPRTASSPGPETLLARRRPDNERPPLHLNDSTQPGEEVGTTEAPY